MFRLCLRFATYGHVSNFANYKIQNHPPARRAELKRKVNDGLAKYLALVAHFDRHSRRDYTVLADTAARWHTGLDWHFRNTSWCRAHFIVDSRVQTLAWRSSEAMTYFRRLVEHGAEEGEAVKRRLTLEINRFTCHLRDKCEFRFC